MQFYIAQNGQQQGPVDLEVVRARLADGTYQRSDLGWHEGAADWLPLSAIPALAGAAAASPEAPAGGFPAAQTYPAYPAPTPTSGLSIASLILGILAFFTCITGIPAVICGHLALTRIKQAQGAVAGRGMAITGLVTGYLGIALTLFFVLLGMALPVFNAVAQKGAAVKSVAEAKQIGLACKLYAGDHNGNFPQTLDQLVPTYLPDGHLFVCPLGKDTPESSGYDYFGGKDSDAPDRVLLSSQARTRDHKKVVVHVDDTASLERE